MVKEGWCEIGGVVPENPQVGSVECECNGMWMALGDLGRAL